MMSCGEAGVVGMVPGLIGILEAIEALKIIVGVEGVLSQEMLIYDGIRTVFKKVKLRGRQK
jgi:adenylyltransferase/sulfurtransferase